MSLQKTLALLWSILFHCKMPTLVDVNKLKKEVATLRACYPKVEETMARLGREGERLEVAAAGAGER